MRWWKATGLVVQRVWYYAKAFYNRFDDEDTFLLAAGIAFNGILCLIPVLLLVTSVVGIFLHGSPASLHKQIDNALNSIFPSQPYAQQIKLLVQNMISDVMRHRSAYGISGIVAFVWTATSLFSSIRTVVNRVYRIRTRKLVHVKIIENVVLVIILTILFFVANAFTWILQFVQALVRDIPSFEHFSLSIVAKSVPLVASYLSALIMFFILNRFIPERGINRRVASIAALTSTTLWWVASKGFSWYLTTFHSYNKLYGTYAVILVFLVWIYYSSIVFIVGVIVGELYREHHPGTDRVESVAR